jgi:hypothetical protein
MSSRLGPVEVDCDAPPHQIVKACEKVGFVTPLDVRWRRAGPFLEQQLGKSAGFGFHGLLTLFGQTPHPEARCSCGQPLPLMEGCTFVLPAKEKLRYLLGQCTRCWTMYWDIP